MHRAAALHTWLVTHQNEPCNSAKVGTASHFASRAQKRPGTAISPKPSILNLSAPCRTLRSVFALFQRFQWIWSISLSHPSWSIWGIPEATFHPGTWNLHTLQSLSEASASWAPETRSGDVKIGNSWMLFAQVWKITGGYCPTVGSRVSRFQRSVPGPASMPLATETMTFEPKSGLLKKTQNLSAPWPWIGLILFDCFDLWWSSEFSLLQEFEDCGAKRHIVNEEASEQNNSSAEVRQIDVPRPATACFQDTSSYTRKKKMHTILPSTKPNAQ